ncbi:hypothetical protein K457DRAFT_890221 [Linnemannia elongata AG-77]|uniref:Uncharacterized protein n=1 Tax=Linnemannia elongata AG-77 TaxID=1314771 RepID=A0A197JB73_9FUNG|nr:hypothetical protein K457DRAFT_890221 [Linnemannia elongata AG-77]
MGHWHQGLQEGKSYVAVVSYDSNCVRCRSTRNNKKTWDEWTLKANTSAQPEDLKSRTCPGCGKICSRDNCAVRSYFGKSWYRPLCKECQQKKWASLDSNQRTTNYFERWWLKRSSEFKSHVLADGLVVTVFLHGVCVGVPQLSERDVAHLRLQAQDSTSIDWYDHEPLVAGDRNPMERFSKDRTTSGRDKKMLPYSHRHQCTVAASAWKNSIFWDLTLEQRVEYMLYWCDPKKREEGFQKADTVILELFEGFDPDEEMKIDFTAQDESRWRDFKTSALFYGTDLENCRKGIQMLRDLMIETAEKMKHRLSSLLEEQAALIAGREGRDDKDAPVLEGAAEGICDQYKPTTGDMALTDMITQSMAMDMGNMDPEETEVSIWAIADEHDFFSDDEDDELDSVIPMPSLDSAEDLSQDGNLFRRHIDHRLAKPPSDSTPGDLALYITAVVPKNGPSLATPLKQLPIDDFLLRRGKENQSPQTSLFAETSLFAQSSSSRHHNTTSFDGSSETKTPKHGRSGQAKAGGFATASTEGKYVESRNEAAASDDDDDFMPRRATTKNVPIVKKVSAKKQRR